MPDQDLIDIATAEVRAYCGWHIAPVEPFSATLDVHGSSVLMLPTLLLRDVDQVVSGGVALDVQSYEWSEAGMLRLRNGAHFPDRYQYVVVDYMSGYDEMPIDVQGVIDRMASLADELRDSSQVLSQVGGVRYAVGVEGLRDVGLLTDSNRVVLDRYRIPPRP